MSEPTAERWLPVVNHPGYEVSDHGRVRSVDRVVTYVDGRVYRYNGRLMTLTPRGEGYLYVRFRYANRPIHSLVLEAFVGARPAEKVACHWDDDPTNNHLSNLRWGSPVENSADLKRNRGYYQQRRTRCPRGHLLAPPNIVPSDVTYNRRGCQSCARAGNIRRKCIKRGKPVPDWQTLADAYYATIMAFDGGPG